MELANAMGTKTYSTRTSRPIKEIAWIVKHTCEDRKMLGVLAINLAARTDWRSVPTDSYQHSAFAVLENEPDWSTRFVWESGSGSFAVDFIANEVGGGWEVSATALFPLGALGNPAPKIAKKVISQL